MRNDHPLYLPFLESLQNKTTACLDLFKEHTFWSELADEEKRALASLFLKRAEEALEEKNEEQLNECSRLAEEISGERDDVLLNISTLFYRYGVYGAHKQSLLLGLGKMVQIEEKNPHVFEADYRASQLWGNLLTALH